MYQYRSTKLCRRAGAYRKWCTITYTRSHIGSLIIVWINVWLIFSNYWMRLSRIWRILQIKEAVIHRGRRPRWITPSEICRILHILRKPNSIIALLLIQNISPFLKEFRHFALCFSAHQNNTTLSPGFRGQRFSNLQRAALLTSFWHRRFNNFQRAVLLTSLVQYLVNSSWLWCVMRAVLTNQKWGNVMKEY